MCSDYALRTRELGKCYHIYETPRDRLKQFLIPRLRRAVGLPARPFFSEFWALKNISLDVARGETVGVIGRNGSGKSTLLQMLCGTLAPTTGAVEMRGRVAALLELGAGFNPEFTGRENVYLNASILGLSRAEIDERFDSITAFADIGEFIERPVKTYSSGMYVRLAFAVIAHVEADILVIDEALSVGDAFFVQKCMRFLRGFMERGTVLFVSHDTGAVLNLCQRAIWLEQGEVRAVGEPQEVAAKYLENLVEDQQGPGQQAVPLEQECEEPPELIRDMRLDFINASPLRNDIKVFAFRPEAEGFGKGGADFIDVQLLDSCGNTLSWVVGGEEVCLQLRCIANKELFSPIVGFMVKDRLGQVVFADNTYLSFAAHPLEIQQNEAFNASFHFVMPLLPVGDYTVAVAVAEGTQAEHVQHRWIHEALSFRSQSSSIVHGLVGIPMKRIQLERI